MNTLAGQIVAGVLCCAMIYAEWRRGYFARLAPCLRQRRSQVYARMLIVSALLAAAIVPFDPRLQAFVQGLHAPLVVAWIQVGGWLGKGTSLWFILSAIYAAARILRRATVQAVAFGCVISAALASIASTFIKWATARARPNTNLGHLSFFHWSEVGRSLFQSLPSGDTIIVAAVAWYLAYRCRNVPLGLRLIVFLLPLATACSRVFVNRHWPSDTILSFGLAAIAAHCVARYETFCAAQSSDH